MDYPFVLDLKFSPTSGVCGPSWKRWTLPWPGLGHRRRQPGANCKTFSSASASVPLCLHHCTTEPSEKWFIQRSNKWFVRGWENSITALAHLFCLTLTGSCIAMFCKPFFTSLYICFCSCLTVMSGPTYQDTIPHIISGSAELSLREGGVPFIRLCPISHLT